MSSWPSPQKTSQWNGNVPIFVGREGDPRDFFRDDVLPDLERGKVEAVNPI
jgi:hypothetical protein